MWTQQTPSGRWQFFENYKDPLTGKTKVASVTADKNTTASRKIAQDRLREKIDAKTGNCAIKPQITLQSILDAYAADQERRMKPDTVDRNRRVLQKAVDAIGADALAEKLNAVIVRQSLPSKPSTYNERLTRFKAMMRWAYQNDLTDNISFLDKLPLLPDDKKARIQDKYMTRDELQAVTAAMKEEKWRLLTEFLALTGLRIGEAMALLKSDVDLKTMRISVNKTYAYQIKPPRVLDSPKTDSSNRVVPIQPELIPIIRQTNELMSAIAGIHNNLFFHNERGTYICYDAYRQYLGDVTARVIGRRLTPHALRHTMTSLFAESGVPLDVISRRLGHADSKITKEIYFHITEGLIDSDAAAVAGVMLF